MNLQLKIPPVIVVVITAAVMWVIDFYLHFSWATFNSSLWIIVPILVAAGLFSMFGLFQFFKYSTSVDPHKPQKANHLVTDGIYRISRNPMYVGLFLILTAYGFYLGNLLTFLILPLFFWYINRYQILPEEEVMEQKFGETYLQYKSEVRRWL